MKRNLDNIKQNNRGFTLVEIIVVLVILAVLAAVSIPTMVGFVEDAKSKSQINYVRQLYVAAQAAATEGYSLKVEDSNLLLRDADGNKCGRITNNALYRVQNNRDMNFPNQMDINIAESILKYLSSNKKGDADIVFTSSTNPQGFTVDDYTSRYKQPGIIVVYTEEGKITMVEYGVDGYLYHMEPGKSVTVTKNGIFSIYPK